MTEPVPRRGDDSAGQAEGAGQAASSESQGGEAACWAHLACPECGAMTSEGHRQGCISATPRRDAAR